ncbi:MAG: 50S ribosomal protein L24 [Myxococcota bacterium]|jgi:large subunit ribosomal protein L24|nr:50S ribosomal protein L24 [Myxococcota bacterium]
MSKIRSGDLVQVISGADRGKQGAVIAVDRAGSRVRVEGVKMQKHHMKPGRRGAQQGGIIEQEGYIAASNVMAVNSADGKPSRIRIEEKDGKRTRVFARGGQPLPESAGS